MPGFSRIGFLRAVVRAPGIEVGEYTYYDDPDGPEHFVERCVMYHYPAVGDRLIIGRFCSIATGVRFIMNGANHAMRGFSTYPFNIFGAGWEEGFDPATWEAETRGDTVVGDDVWLGTSAVLMPGVTVGSGAIVGALSVVSADVPPYTVVVGNPARVVRTRFDPETIERLLAVAWWDWPAEQISRNLDAIRGADLAALEAAV